MFVLFSLLIGCGGGGGGGGGSNGGSGGGGATLVGRIVDVQTGAAPATPPSVQTSTQTVQAAADGSFSVNAPVGATQVLIDSLTADGTFTYTFPSVPNGTTDLGDLWIGPQRLTLTGRVVDSTNGLPIGGAVVSFAGRMATTANNGTFSLPQVAYSSSAPAAFLGIMGSINAQSYILLNFTAGSGAVVAGVLSTGDLLLTPTSNPNPPGPPYSITGVVKPLGNSTGTVVTLNQSGHALRIFNVGADGTYSFWVGPGTYTITYVKGTLTAPTQTVTVQNQGSTVTVPDVTLH